MGEKKNFVYAKDKSEIRRNWYEPEEVFLQTMNKLRRLWLYSLKYIFE